MLKTWSKELSLKDGYCFSFSVGLGPGWWKGVLDVRSLSKLKSLQNGNLNDSRNVDQ